jgi:hypothetical protein
MGPPRVLAVGAEDGPLAARTLAVKDVIYAPDDSARIGSYDEAKTHLQTSATDRSD